MYEALLANPAAVLRDLTGRLGLPYEEGMLEFAGATESLVAVDELVAWKRETLGPLLTTNAGKWRQELSPWEAALAERVCREGVTVAGAVEQPRHDPSRGVRLAVGCLAPLLRIIEWRYRAYRRCTLLWRIRG